MALNIVHSWDIYHNRRWRASNMVLFRSSWHCTWLSSDGFGPFRRRIKTAWPIILFNYNLPPEERFSSRTSFGLEWSWTKETWRFWFIFMALVQELLQLEIGVLLTKTLFLLHAYLIAVFVTYLRSRWLCTWRAQCNFPCCMCTIKGVHIPSLRVTTHYVPLCRDGFPDSQEQYDHVRFCYKIMRHSWSRQRKSSTPQVTQILKALQPSMASKVCHCSVP